MVEDKPPWPEPAPNWPEAKQVWKWSWPFHVWFFATLYTIVVVRSIQVLYKQLKEHFQLRTRKTNHRPYMNLILLAFGLTRAVFLIWDPYGSNPNHSKPQLVVCIILFGIGTACITSAFSILLLIILESTRISLGPSRFQNLSFLLAVLVINVLYVTVSDLVVAHFNSAKIMILICQITFAIWGILIASGFTLAAVRLWRNVKASRQTAQNVPSLSEDNKKVLRLVSLMYLASFSGVVMFSVIIYSALGDTGVFNETGEVRNWPWLAVQTLLRSCETGMCLLIFLIALKTTTSPSSAAINQVEVKPN